MKVNGIQLPSGLGASLGAATSPEESAKLFMNAATKGLAKVIADSVLAAVGETVGVGSTPPDWTKLIKACVLQVDWETPPGTALQKCVAFSESDSGPVLGGIGFSVGISGTF